MSELLLATNLTNHTQHDLWKYAVIHAFDHEMGSMGFIMNQPVANFDHKHITQMYGVGSLPRTRIFCGGPILTDRCTIAHTPEYRTADTRVLTDQLAITFSRDIVQDINQGRGPKRYKVMLGFCKWEQGQLTAEITRRQWQTTEYSELMWSSYKAKDKMWRRIIDARSRQAAGSFLDTVMP